MNTVISDDDADDGGGGGGVVTFGYFPTITPPLPGAGSVVSLPSYFDGSSKRMSR